MSDSVIKDSASEEATAVEGSIQKSPTKNGDATVNLPIINGTGIISEKESAVAQELEKKHTTNGDCESPATTKTDLVAEKDVSEPEVKVPVENTDADDAQPAAVDPTSKATDFKSPTKTDKDDDKEKDANYYLARGKRELAIGDYTSAVDYLSKACEKSSAEYGELADEVGDAYFLYGKALLCSYREGITVLGDRINKGEAAGEADSSEDDDEGEEKGDNGSEEKSEEVAGADTPVEPVEAERNATAEEGAPGFGETAEALSDDLELSWEFLEMAKVIFSRKADEDKEIAIKLSEVYLNLGENGLETESYATAIADFETCLDIQKNYMPADDRRIAATLYQLGITYNLMENMDEAVKLYEASISQLDKRLLTLETAKKDGKKHPDGESHDAFYSIDDEMRDICDSIKELRLKIEDTQGYEANLKQELMERLLGEMPRVARSTAGETSASTSSSVVESPFVSSSASLAATTTSSEASSSKPVSNISHLVRKKRKNDDEPEKEDKKAKTDNVLPQ